MLKLISGDRPESKGNAWQILDFKETESTFCDPTQLEEFIRGNRVCHWKL